MTFDGKTEAETLKRGSSSDSPSVPHGAEWNFSSIEIRLIQ